ncbi:hypothetical protein [Dactylococcopsis salina]|uniref:hypothetical protein n=1 Tax=Dactylococcopsis salina TaxID=292566 RepID=UPI0003046E85|nr:hypothetical protein [Dactylococcopsis salina]
MKEKILPESLGKNGGKTTAPSGLSARSLSKRLGVDRKTLTRWKEKGNEILIERTRDRDPDGKAWVFNEGSKMYVEESNGV